MTEMFEADVERRARIQKNEHPILTRLIVLRVALNHEFGHAALKPYDHELATIERDLAEILGPQPDRSPNGSLRRQSSSGS